MATIDLKKLGGIIGRGFIPELAPSIIKGLIIEFFKQKKVDIKELSSWIEKDVSLWGKVGPQHRQQIMKFASKLGDIRWLTADWLVEGMRKDLPNLCSLFLGWPEAYSWLERQVKEIKGQLLPPNP